jgi:hypothetical protein
MTSEALDFEARIQRLEDIESIRTLKGRYHTYVNDTDFDRVGSLFAVDASLNLGYLMPDEAAIIGREEIQAAFSGMKSNTSQSQLKQFLHSHIVEVTGPHSASGTGMLYACYGVHADAYVVAGKYSEEYVRVDAVNGSSKLWIWPCTSLFRWPSAGPGRNGTISSTPGRRSPSTTHCCLTQRSRSKRPTPGYIQNHSH